MTVIRINAIAVPEIGGEELARQVRRVVV